MDICWPTQVAWKRGAEQNLSHTANYNTGKLIFLENTSTYVLCIVKILAKVTNFVAYYILCDKIFILYLLRSNETSPPNDEAQVRVRLDQTCVVITRQSRVLDVLTDFELLSQLKHPRFHTTVAKLEEFSNRYATDNNANVC